MAAQYQLTSAATIIRRTSDGAQIPDDPANADYREYLAWVADGNTADPVPTVPPPTTLSPWAFLQRFTPAEQLAVQTATSASPTLALPLTQGLASGVISLTDSALQQWMQALVNSGAITAARMTAILTP